MIGPMRTALERADDLPVIDLDVAGAWDAPPDCATFEDRYAQLAFGLGTVPRRQHRDDPLWQRPAGLLLLVALLLLLLVVSSG